MLTGVIAFTIFIIILLLSRSYVLSFFVFAAAALCIMEGSLAEGLVRLFEDGLYGQITDPSKAAMVAFISLYCGYVGSMEYGGPIKGFTLYVANKGSNKAVFVQLKAWVTSVGAFFSDLGSPGIVGTIFRQKYNEAKISREKLGLTINLTAVPVCSMIPLVGWGLFTIGIINNTAAVMGERWLAISVFFHSIPYFCLSFMAILTPLLLMRDNFIIGRLSDHEDQAQNDIAAYIADRKQEEVEIELAKENGKGFTLFLSLAVMIGVLLIMLSSFNQRLLTAEVYPFMISLGIAFVTASMSAMLKMWLMKEKPFMKSYALYTDMFKRTVTVTGIMVVSWIFFDVAWQTGIYQQLTRWLGSWLPVILILPAVFISGAFMSTLTGSAWGTYAVVMPLGILLSQTAGLSVFAGIGAAVSGGVYGDISAVNSHAMNYSAESAGVNKEEFRKVQQPYMYCMAAASVAGYGFGALLDTWYSYIAIALVTYVALIFMENKRKTKMEV